MNKILIVDDDAMMRTLLVKRFKLRKKDFQIMTAADGYTALEVLKLKSIDLVVTDYQMPKMDGMEVFVEMRKLYPRLPVIMMSGYNDDKLSKSFLQAGGAAFIKKPFCTDELIVKMKDVLKKSDKQYKAEHQYRVPTQSMGTSKTDPHRLLQTGKHVLASQTPRGEFLRRL